MAVRFNVQFSDGALPQAMAMMDAAKSMVHPHEGSIGIHEEDGSRAKINDLGQPQDQNVATVMADHEYGNGVPERSFLRDYFDGNRDRMMRGATAAMRKEVQAGVNYVFKGTRHQPAMGHFIKRWFVLETLRWSKHIAKGEGLAPLSEGRIREKEFMAFEHPDTPLRATSQFFNSWKGVWDGVFIDPVATRSASVESSHDFNATHRVGKDMVESSRDIRTHRVTKRMIEWQTSKRTFRVKNWQIQGFTNRVTSKMIVSGK